MRKLRNFSIDTATSQLCNKTNKLRYTCQKMHTYRRTYPAVRSKYKIAQVQIYLHSICLTFHTQKQVRVYL